MASLDVIRAEILPELPRRSTAAHRTHWLTSDRLPALEPSGSSPAPLHNSRAGGGGRARTFRREAYPGAHFAQRS